MSYCSMQCDYPLRVQFGPGLVIHAAYMRRVGGHLRHIPNQKTGEYKTERVPVTKRINLACRTSWRWYQHKEIEKSCLVDNTTTITCKACAKAMGMSESRTDPIRYVIFKKSTGEYYKKGRFCSQPWVEDVGDATLYKIKGVAEKKAERRYYERLDGTRVKYQEMVELRRAGEQINAGQEKNPDLEVKIVTLVVG